MGRRRRSREYALQILFELEFNPDAPADVVRQYWERQKAEPDVRAYTGWIIDRILSGRDEIDRSIQAASKNWRISRMAVVDRNVLRIAVCELLFEPSLVPAIVINEAIEIAKKFSGHEAATFVNGILDAIRKDMKKRVPAESENVKEGHHEPE